MVPSPGPWLVRGDSEFSFINVEFQMVLRYVCVSYQLGSWIYVSELRGEAVARRYTFGSCQHKGDEAVVGDGLHRDQVYGEKRRLRLGL